MKPLRMICSNKNLLLVMAMALLLHCTVAYAQGDRMDRALDSYQAICDKCILLKERSMQGERIAPEELTSLLEQVSELRSTLQKGSRNMSPAQKVRFETIRRRYTVVFGGTSTSSDRTALEVSRPEMMLPKIDDGGKVLHPAFGYAQNDRGGLAQDDKDRLSQDDKGSAADSPHRQPSRPGQPEGTKLPKDISTGVAILGGWRPETFSYGAMLTLSCDRWGIYVKGRSNFQSRKADYKCDSDGTAAGHPIWTSGKECHTDMELGGGGIFRIAGQLSLYAGSGYGNSQTLWEDSAGRWARVEDYSAKGLCADWGVIWARGHFRTQAGVSVINLKKPVLEVGIGINF